METLNVGGFSKGLITRIPDTDIDNLAFSDCDNIDLNERYFPTKCKGELKYNNTSLGSYPITGGILYKQNDGTKHYIFSCYNKIYYSVAGSGTFTSYKIDVGGSPVDLTIDTSSFPNFIQYNNCIYITNGKYPIITNTGYTTSKMIKISNITASELTDANIPQGAKYLTLHQERLFAASSIDQPNGLYWTEPYSPEDWLPTSGLNYDYVGKDDGENISAITSYQDYLYVLKPKNIYRYSTIGDITQWSSTLVDTINGCLYDKTLCEMDGFLYYLSSLGVVKFDGNNAIVVSEQIRDKILGLTQSNSKNLIWNKTNTSEFEDGIYGPYTITSTATGGTTDTLIDTALTEANDYWIGGILTITAGTNSGQIRYITDYNSTTFTLTVDEVFASACDTTTEYELKVGDTVVDITNNQITNSLQDSVAKWDNATKSNIYIDSNNNNITLATTSGEDFGQNIASQAIYTSTNGWTCPSSVAGTHASGSYYNRIYDPTHITQAEYYWINSTIKFLSGNNIGVSRTITNSTATGYIYFDDLDYAVVANDTYQITSYPLINTNKYLNAVVSSPSSSLTSMRDTANLVQEDGYWNGATIKFITPLTTDPNYNLTRTITSYVKGIVYFNTLIVKLPNYTNYEIYARNEVLYTNTNNSNLIIDLGNSYSVDYVYFKFSLSGTSGGGKYGILPGFSIYYSQDNVNYTLLSTVSRSSNSSYGYIFAKRYCRYFKIIADINTSYDCGQLSVKSIEIKESYAATGYILTQTLDYGFTPNSLGKLIVKYLKNVDYTSIAGTDILLQTQTSSDNITWGALADVSSDFTINSTPNRYIRCKATLTSQYGVETPVLYSIGVMGIYRTEKKDLGFTPTEWGYFTSSFDLNDQELTFWVRSASSTSALDTALWYQQYPGSIITNLTLNRYIQIEYRLNIIDINETITTKNSYYYGVKRDYAQHYFYFDELPIIDSTQINYIYGLNLCAPCAIVWKDNYWINIPIGGSQINNLLYVYNKDGYWLKRSNLYSNIFFIDDNYLLSGSSLSTGFINYNDISTSNINTNLVVNGEFTSDTSGWTGVGCTLASVAGGISGNCLELARTGTGLPPSGNIVQTVYQSINTNIGSTYNIGFSTKISTGVSDTWQLNISSAPTQNLEMKPFDLANSNYNIGIGDNFNTIIFTSNYAIDMRGQKKATRMYCKKWNVSTSHYYKRFTPLLNGAYYVFSAYIKANNNTYGQLSLGGNGAHTIYTPTDEWTRVVSPPILIGYHYYAYVGFGSVGPIDSITDVLITNIQFEKNANASEFVELETIDAKVNKSWINTNILFTANTSNTILGLRKFSSFDDKMYFDNVFCNTYMNAWFETRNFELSTMKNILRNIFITSKSNRSWTLSYSIDNGEYIDIVINYSTYVNTIKKTLAGIKRGQYIKFKINQNLDGSNFEFHSLSLEYEPWRTLNND